MRRKHQRRVLINLLAIAVLAMFLWVHDGCPLPTLEMELHRTERRMLAEESRVVWTYDGRQTNQLDRLVGVSPEWVHVGYECYLPLFWPRTVTEPTLVLLPDFISYTTEDGEGPYATPTFLAVDPPAGAESVQLTLDLSHLFQIKGYNSLVEPYVLQGEKQGEAFSFYLLRHYTGISNTEKAPELWLRQDAEGNVFKYLMDFLSWNCDLSDCPYTLEFFDGGGALIGTYDNPAAGPAVSTS